VVISDEPMTAEEWSAKYGRNDGEPLPAGAEGELSSLAALPGPR
jgi:hypothetical protein